MREARRGQQPAFLLLVCSALILIALVGHGWQTLGIGGAGSIGPLGIDSCVPGTTDCTSLWWSAVPLSGPVPLFALLTLVTGVVAFAFALACAGLAVVGRLGDMPHRSARVLLALAIPVATTWQILLATRHEVAALTELEMTYVGYGGVLCVVSMCVGWLAVHRLARHARHRTVLAPSPSSLLPHAVPPVWQQPPYGAPPTWQPESALRREPPLQQY